MTKPEAKLQSLLEPTVVTKEAKKVIELESPSPLYVTVFKQAEMYNKAYLMLKSSMDQNNVLDLISPMLMNLCFSIELLLKAFVLSEHAWIHSYTELASRGVNIRGHKYSDLFIIIKDKHRKSILVELSENLKIPSIDDSTFKRILVSQNCDNSFAEWRYIFEETQIKSLNTELLIILNDVLGKQLFQLIKLTK
ncbi:MAG: hypothetical protein RIB63_21985 [Fulvivirga sp.]